MARLSKYAGRYNPNLKPAPIDKAKFGFQYDITQPSASDLATEGRRESVFEQLKKAAGSELMNRTAQQTVRNAATTATPTASPAAKSGGGGGKTSPGQDAWDGFASRYVPGERALLFSNPGIIVQDWLDQGKYRNNPQMAGDLLRYADIVFGNESQGGLFELMNRGALGDNFGDDDQINWLVNLLNEQSKVGGRSPTLEGMLNALYEGFEDPNSTMGAMLKDGAGDPVGTQQAIGALMQFIPLLGSFTGNIRYSNAIRRIANQKAQEYMRDTAKGKAKGSFLDYMQDNFLT